MGRPVAGELIVVCNSGEGHEARRERSDDRVVRVASRAEHVLRRRNGQSMAGRDDAAHRGPAPSLAGIRAPGGLRNEANASHRNPIDLAPFQCRNSRRQLDAGIDVDLLMQSTRPGLTLRT